MANFANMTASLNLNFSNFTSGLRSAAAQANKFAAQLNGQINSGMVDPVKKAKFEFKDVARIVQGIMISKAFYGGLNAIRNATSSVWEFSKELEYAKIAYTNLFGNSELAVEFINVLKDFAAVTPFTFTDAEAAAKRLLAYGIEYKNVMYIMQGVLAASTMQGNPQVIESVSRALGQIYTKGRLMNEEMRQLAEAGIPAYEILADKLGLTNEQLRSLGKNAIPANIAINALIDGINERFGGVLDASSMTITGVISNIVDNATMLFSGMFEPLTMRIKEVFADVGNLLSVLRSVFEIGGIGAVFERLVPPELQTMLRTLTVNLLNLWSIIKFNLAGAWLLFKQIILAVTNALNMLLPIINMVIGAVSALVGAIQRNEAVMKVLVGLVLAAASAWAVYKVQALLAAATTAVIKGITAALKGMAALLTFIAVHPVWGILAIGLALLIGLSGAANKVSEAFRNLFKGFSKFGGVDPDKILLADSKDRAADLDKFNERLGQTGSGIDALTDKTDKAAKAAKGLLSFDEVFKLTEPSKESDVTDFENIVLPDFSGIGGTLMPEMPDFNSFAADFVGNLTTALGGQKKLLGTGIGAVLGAAVGGIIGGPFGAKIGAILGAFAGWFWDDLAKALNLTEIGTIALPITTGLGAAIGGLIGGPPGALIGAGIGALVGWFIDSITRGIKTGDWSSLTKMLSTVLGAAVGGLAAGPAGAILGASIALFGDWLVNKFVTLWQNSTEIRSAIAESFVDTFDSIGLKLSSWFDNTYAKFSTWWKDTKKGFIDWFNQTSSGFTEWRTDSRLGFDTWWLETKTGFSDWAEKVKLNFTKLRTDSSYTVLKWSNDTLNTFGEWWNTSKKGFIDWVVETYAKLNSWATDASSLFTRWLVETKDSFVSWWLETKNGFTTWAKDTYEGIVEWIDKAIRKIKEFFSAKDRASSEARETTTKTVSTPGHAVGGIFNREHIARFAEGNKAEAIIPLENRSAMQPFVDAVSSGIIQGLGPLLVQTDSRGYDSDQLRPLYVGTLVADERGLRELNRRMRVVQVQEDARRGRRE